MRIFLALMMCSAMLVGCGKQAASLVLAALCDTIFE